MANPPLQSPTNPHFFQPLLPGFNTHLTIPVAFFSKYIEAKNEQKKAKLRSKASNKTWEVTIDGRRFTRGWNDFATAHDLRIGDIIIFKHEGDMVFNVTPFGPSCCEIEYEQSHFIKEEKDNNDDNNENHCTTNKNPLPKTEPKSTFSFDYCFVAQVAASDLKLDTLDLPMEAASSNALNKICHKMIVVNKEGNSWNVNLRFRETNGSYYIRGGWRRFCRDNRL
ncbi:B3 domain-containing protein REM7 [Raphanus sativus]|nr:B3 domain-containing protein REM7 [Raphanus sativus]